MVCAPIDYKAIYVDGAEAVETLSKERSRNIAWSYLAMVLCIMFGGSVVERMVFFAYKLYL